MASCTSSTDPYCRNTSASATMQYLWLLWLLVVILIFVAVAIRNKRRAAMRIAQAMAQPTIAMTTLNPMAQQGQAPPGFVATYVNGTLVYVPANSRPFGQMAVAAVPIALGHEHPQCVPCPPRSPSSSSCDGHHRGPPSYAYPQPYQQPAQSNYQPNYQQPYQPNYQQSYQPHHPNGQPNYPDGQAYQPNGYQQNGYPISQSNNQSNNQPYRSNGYSEQPPLFRPAPEESNGKVNPMGNSYQLPPSYNQPPQMSQGQMQMQQPY